MARSGVECTICAKRFSSADIEAGEYCLETMVCYNCYSMMQQLPHSISCFGKPTFITIGGTRRLGYDERSVECQSICPDRTVCARIMRPKKETNES